MNPRFWIVVLVLAISLAAIYGRALNVPFIYDDNATIVQNESITSVWPIIGPRENPGPLNPPADLPTSGRPLVNLSFAINYAIGGLNPGGYHAVNVVIHFLASLLVWAVVRRTLLLPYFADRFANTAGWLSFAVAMLWALHPLQTETIIYATQRTELMMALFYLATLYCSLRYWSAGEDRARRGLWLTLAMVACLAGMASKEVMVSAPLMVLLFDRAFVSGSLAGALRRSWLLYVGLAATWLLLLFLMVNSPHGESAGFGLRISPYVWWLTQAKVFWLYLKLAAWPWPLLFYYELPLFSTFGDSCIFVLPLLVVGVGTLFLLWRNRPLGYLGTWVFAILAPTSVVPIVTEIAAERRMYLPLVAIVVLAVIGGWLLAQKIAQRSNDSATKTTPPKKRSAAPTSLSSGSVLIYVLVPACVVAVVFAVVDVKRLQSYRDEQTLWREVIRDQPGNVVAHNNLSDLLIHAGKLPEALEVTQSLLTVNPEQPVALNNMSVALIQMGRNAEAVGKLRQAIKLKPDYADAHNHLGLALTNSGQHEEAIREFQESLHLRPETPSTLFNMGIAYGNMGRLPEAIEQYEHVLRLRPNFTDARVNLGATLSMIRRVPQAIEQFEIVLKSSPNDLNALNNLGLLFYGSSRPQEAILQFETALRISPDRADIHRNLADVLRDEGRLGDAIQHYQIAVRLNSSDLQTAMDLAQALAAANRSQEAIATAEEAIRVARGAGQSQIEEQFTSWLKQYQEQIRSGGNTTPNSSSPSSK